jgi:hypothetical protein
MADIKWKNQTEIDQEKQKAKNKADKKAAAKQAVEASKKPVSSMAETEKDQLIEDLRALLQE